MRILLSILSLVLMNVLPFASFAEEAIEPASPPEFTQQALTSATTCYAYTSCFDFYGNYLGQVNCQVYGYQYLQSLGISASNRCSWFVRAGVGVQCSGYQEMYNPYTGQYYWAWNTFTARCPGY